MATHASNTLRTINSRLRDHSRAQLLTLIPQISHVLPDCKSLLASAPTSSKDSADGVVLHTFKTHITTLVNGRTPEERWAGIVLVKATIELGGHEVLQTCKPWVNGLLSLLGKPDGPSTKKLCIITLTRIFVLTQGYQTIIRELTTPSLPTFITSCFELVAPKKPSKVASTQTRTRIQAALLQPIFECFSELLPRHPTIFRTFTTKLRALLAAFLAPTPSSPLVSNETQAQEGFSSSDMSTLIANPAIITAARRLHALLHFSAAKSNDNEYTKRITAIVDSTHATASAAFRSVQEERRSSSSAATKVSADTYSAEVSSVHITATSGLDLPNWNGIHAGCERLTGLIRLLQTYIATSNTAATTVLIPLGSLIDLLVRITSVTVPPPRSSQQNGLNSLLDTGLRPNDQISREEREGLFTQLPTIHSAALDLMSAVLQRFDTATAPWISILLQQTIWIFAAESYNATIRRRCYKVISHCTRLFGRSFSKDTVRVIAPLLRRAANDVTGTIEAASAPGTNGATSTSKGKNGTLNADTLLSSATSTALPLFTQTTSFVTLLPHQTTALDLLRIALLRLPSSLLSPSLRAHLDRAAVISNDKDAMLASVLNPPGNKALAKSASSILPLLVRSHGGSREVEALVRPRMPIIMNRHDDAVADDMEDEEEDEEEEEEDGNAEMVEIDGVEDETSEPKDAASIAAARPLTKQQDPPPPEVTPTPVPITASPATTRKRAASPLPPPTADASSASASASASASKKARISPPSASLPTTAAAGVPVILDVGAMVKPTSQPQTVGVSQVETASSGPVGERGVEDKAESDDEDFVMPTLTMEPDTDDEEEEDEEKE